MYAYVCVCVYVCMTVIIMACGSRSSLWFFVLCSWYGTEYASSCIASLIKLLVGSPTIL